MEFKIFRYEKDIRKTIVLFGTLITFGFADTRYNSSRSIGIVKDEDGQLYSVSINDIKIIED